VDAVHVENRVDGGRGFRGLQRDCGNRVGFSRVSGRHGRGPSQTIDEAARDESGGDGDEERKATGEDIGLLHASRGLAFRRRRGLLACVRPPPSGGGYAGILLDGMDARRGDRNSSNTPQASPRSLRPFALYPLQGTPRVHPKGRGRDTLQSAYVRTPSEAATRAFSALKRLPAPALPAGRCGRRR
jgi:hypothetical protein